MNFLRLRLFILVLVLVIVIGGILILIFKIGPFASTPVPTASALPTKIPKPVLTLTSTWTSTPTFTPTITSTPFLTFTPLPCLNLLEPRNKVKLKDMGPLTFKWDTRPDATWYTIEIKSPGGNTVFSQTLTANQKDKFLESLPEAGVYQWQVSAINGDGRIICSSAVFSFTKAKFEPTITQVPVDGDGDEIVNDLTVEPESQ